MANDLIFDQSDITYTTRIATCRTCEKYFPVVTLDSCQELNKEVHAVCEVKLNVCPLGKW